MSRLRLSLCLLVRNELPGCKADVPRLPRDAFDEIYAVDGGSTDGTVEFLEQHGIPVHRQPKKGLNAAYHHAVNVTRSDAVVVFFPKGTIDPASLRTFRPLLEDGAGMVIASRMIAGGRNEEDDKIVRPRKWGVLALALGAAVLWRREGHRVRDILHGVKGMTVEAFRAMRIQDHGVSIDLEMTARAYKLRIPRAEFPVRENARFYGESNFKIIPTAKKLLSYIWFELRRKD
jgi:glycosyltransferase involved in cell wall biosynthesis